MKILITGAGGQLGHDCRRVFAAEHDVIAFGHKELDISRRDQVDATIARIDPELVVNCAAHTGVDACETDATSARRINVDGPRNLVDSLRRQGGRLLHISTDYVFDGRKPIGRFYTETDSTGPLSVYGKTKLDGETAVRALGERHVIVRTAWLYGIRGRNFLKTMLSLARRNPTGEIKVVNDQFGSPTWSYRLALQMARLIETGGQGTYHATAEGVSTWYDLAEHFLKIMGVPHRLRPCASDEFPTPAARPRNGLLENRRLKAAGIHVMVPWREDVTQFVRQFRDRLMEEASASK
jgi:dTDP-4-dehydrorhamnose reductase